MLGVFRESGFHISVRADAGQLQVTFPTSLSNEAAYKFEHLDCNPFIVHEQGAVILDARVRIAAASPTRLLGVR